MAQSAESRIGEAYRGAKSAYAAVGVDADAAIEAAVAVPVSVHCWQGDDVRGFEAGQGAADSGGLLATGNYPGRARSADELRGDLEEVLSLVPGTHRANVHAIYAETGGKKVDRDALEAEGKGAQKLALLEEAKTLPFGAVWDMLCLRAGVPPAGGWMPKVEAYEKNVLAKRRSP